MCEFCYLIRKLEWYDNVCDGCVTAFNQYAWPGTVLRCGGCWHGTRRSTIVYKLSELGLTVKDYPYSKTKKA